MIDFEVFRAAVADADLRREREAKPPPAAKSVVETTAVHITDEAAVSVAEIRL